MKEAVANGNCTLLQCIIPVFLEEVYKTAKNSAIFGKNVLSIPKSNQAFLRQKWVLTI
jgi:hypothetical protein